MIAVELGRRFAGGVRRDPFVEEGLRVFVGRDEPIEPLVGKLVQRE